MNYGNERYIAITADGPTDTEILFRFAACLLETQAVCRKVTVKESLRKGMDTFMKKASEKNDYKLFGNPARLLREAVIKLLESSIGEFQTKISRELRYTDLLILHTDSEKHLNRSEQYFEEWAISISRIILTAIEDFCEKKVRQGYDLIYLPLIIPIIPFPSTEILIAAAKTGNRSRFKFRGMKARDLKTKLYGVTDLGSLDEETFQTEAMRIITPESCRAVYKHVPEARSFLHTLIWNQPEVFF